MSDIEIGLRVFWICLTFGFLTLLSVIVCFWLIFPEKEEKDGQARGSGRVGRIE